MSDNTKLSVKLFPLRKKEDKKHVEVKAVSAQMDGIPLILYKQMSRAINMSLKAADEPEKFPPIIIHVLNPSEDYSHFLAYYPKSGAIALRLLQLLYLMPDDERTEFVNALYIYDDFTPANERAAASALVVQKLGTSDTGKWERTHDIDDLERFTYVLYIQQCITMK